VPPGGAKGLEIVVFHSALGLRPGVAAWADKLRAVGHTVHTPDLYSGEIFDDLEAGMHKYQALGMSGLVARAQAALAGLGEELVYAGFALGGALAERLGATRSKSRGVILMHAALPLAAVGLTAWPRAVPLQVHYAVDDPWRNREAIDSLAASVRRSGALFQQYDYPGSGHLFADPDLPDHNPAAAEMMFRRVTDFLDRIGHSPSGP
jgi:dienelactone hydrolase